MEELDELIKDINDIKSFFISEQNYTLAAKARVLEVYLKSTKK